MSFIKAERIAKCIHMSCLGLLVGFIMLKNTHPVPAWICFGVMMVLCCVTFPISWKHMRCPYCTHVIPVFRRDAGTCNACGKPLTLNDEGYLIVVKEKGSGVKKKKKKKS